MPISAKDKEFMEKVATYFRSTKSPSEPKGSIRETANRFEINRNKVRKILITTGDLNSPITDDAVLMRNQGLSIKDIAKDLGVSVATVSTALPYENKIDNTLDPTDHASKVREYRAYEQKQIKRQAEKKSKNENVPVTWKGDAMTKQNEIKREWQKDIKMSYTEAYHRPRRKTWEDFDEMKEFLIGEMGEDAPDELKDIFEVMNLIEKNDDVEQELEKLLAKEKLTDEEKNRLPLLLIKTGQFTGALNNRNNGVLEDISGERLPFEPLDVLRLHMELYSEYADNVVNDDIAKVFRKYGKVEHGRSISRDVIVPADIPLYALHYVIQRAFGWENSHLHQFNLPDDRFKALTDNNACTWSRMVGVLFRSPLMDEDDEFWADDYNGGSFKNWLRKKYTGPYLSQCYGEGIVSCYADMKRLDMDADCYVMYVKRYNQATQRYDGEEFLSTVTPVMDYQGNKSPEPKPWTGDKNPYRVEIVKFKEVPAEGIKYLFERDPRVLLERLPLDSVLAAGHFELLENSPPEEREYVKNQMIHSGEEMYIEVEKEIKDIIQGQIDSPEMQVQPIPITDTLLYTYDFGDGWKIRITASDNCLDLVKSGRITQSELDRANVKCREVYRPVLIARDGEMLVDDVGGISGFAEFLKIINPDLKHMSPEEKEEAKQEKKEYIEWAKGLGWHRERPSNFNLL